MNKNEIYFTITKTISNGYERYRIQKQVNGQKINVTGKTKKEVTEKFYTKLEENKRQAKANTSIDINKISFADFVHYYLYDVVEPAKSIEESTFITYKSHYVCYIKGSFFEKIKLIELQTEQLQKFFNEIMKKDLSITYIKRIKVFITTILNYAVANDLIVKNYCKNVKLRKEDKKEEKHKFLTENEIDLLLENCEDIKLKTIIILIINTGLRINEALALHVEDIQGGIININKNMIRSNNGYVVGTPKTANSIRKIPVNASLQKHLDLYLIYLKEENLKFGIIIDDNTIMFQNDRFTYQRDNKLRQRLNKIYAESGINTTGFHTLRHTFGSIMYAKGVDIKTISTLLGHKNINVTANTYIHLKQIQNYH